MNKVIRMVITFIMVFTVSILPITAQAALHGATLTWTASTAAATCLGTSNPPCSYGYQIFEGSSTGSETTTPLNDTLITGTSYADTEPTQNAYLGTTRCWVVQFQETIGTVTVNSSSSNEACYTWPVQPAPPGQVVIVIH